MQITNVNIYHKVTHEYREVIEGMWWLIIIDVRNTEEAAEDIVVNDDGADLNEEYV